MYERAWIGPAEGAPEGWTILPSLKEFLGARWHPRHIVLDDPAAVLREADFLQVYAHSPLARLERRVSPWRAGVGRTDPTWPRVTTLASDSCPGEQPGDWSELPLPLPLPMTADYDEIAAALVSQPVCLEGIRVCIQIADGDLHQMWENILHQAGAERVALPDSESVWLVDDFHRRGHAAAGVLCVRLTTAPWLVPPSANEVAFSTSDSPWSVMYHMEQRLRRGDGETQ